MSLAEQLFNQTNPTYFFLSIIALISLWKRSLWPIVCIGLVQYISNPIYACAYALFLNFQTFSNTSKTFKLPNNKDWLIMISIFLLFLSTMNDIRLNLLLLTLPFLLFYPTKEAISKNKGGTPILLSLVIYCGLEAVQAQTVPMKALFLINVYFLVLYVYKAMPLSLSLSYLIALSCSGLAFFLTEEYFYLGSLMLIYFYLVQHSKEQNTRSCLKTKSAWFHIAWITASFFYSTKFQINPFMFISLFLIFMISQSPQCSLCLFKLKCKEKIFIQFSSLLPSIYLTFSINGFSFNNADVILLVLFSIACSQLKWRTAEPTNADLLMFNTCTEEYKLSKV